MLNKALWERDELAAALRALRTGALLQTAHSGMSWGEVKTICDAALAKLGDGK
jgi:hypothetical protein